jgi:hypothetical protein
MPATIIIRIDDDQHAQDIMAAGAKDLGSHLLHEACIYPSRVSLCYRSPAEEKKALAGELAFKETRDVWYKIKDEAGDQSTSTPTRGSARTATHD